MGWMVRPLLRRMFTVMYGFVFDKSSHGLDLIGCIGAFAESLAEIEGAFTAS